MTRKEMEDFRSYLMRRTNVLGGNITIYENGAFEIRNINDYSVNSIYSMLINDNRVCNLYRTHKYDYSHFDYRFMPKLKYTICGEVVDKARAN